jgi:hypothetical protein
MTATRARRALGATGVAMLVLVGCSSSGPTGAAPEPTDTTATTVPGPSPWVAPTPADLGIEECTAARPPVFVERDTYQQGTTTNGLRPPPDATADTSDEPPTDPSLSLVARSYSRRDPADSSGAIVVQHTSGDPTVLGGKGMVVGFPGGRSWIGDLDGDGVDEVLVISTRPGGSTLASDGGMPVVIVPGTVAAGLQDPFAVGITLPIDGAQGQGAYGVGDIDGDGADDVTVPVADGTTPVVVSGRDLMAAGAGGSITELPRPISAGDPAWSPGAGTTDGLLSLAPGARPVAGVLTAEALYLSTQPATVLRIDEPVAAGGSPPVLTAYRSGGHRIVTLRSNAGRSGVTVTQMWDLDGVCPA